jgi:hypothetical protein
MVPYGFDNWVSVECPRCLCDNEYPMDEIKSFNYFVLCGLCDQEFDVTEMVDE